MIVFEFQAIYPASVELSEKEKLNICYLAFPDSNSGCIGDTQFHIRLRVAPGTKNTMLNSELQRFSLQCQTVQRPDLGHYWGFVYFRQMKDTSLPRGYFQKSVILLSRLPFINLYYEVLALIAPKYFAGGESVLHNACLDISNWPPLQAGECIQLPLLGTQFQTYIPSLTSANLQQPYSSSSATLSQLDQDLKNLSLDSPPSNEATKSAAAAAASIISTDQTSSTSDDELPSVKNDNQNQSSDNNEARIANTNADIRLSREDILDSYKQSKEMLLAQKLKKQTDSPCDSNSSKSTGANNANDYENDANENGGDEADVELDDYFDVGNYSDNNKIDESVNTHAELGSTNIERPLRIANQQSMAKTPVMCLSSATEIDIFRSLYTVISYTHLLWELVLTAEPIVVMATSPSDCSHMVQSLMR